MILCAHTFLFADLCDFTEYTWRYGDDCSVELALGFHQLVRSLAADECCEVIKTIGDAVMVRAPDCANALRLAQRIHAEVAEHRYPKVRIGIDTGPAVPCDGDWYGTTVNRAARVADAAAPGELLVTEQVREAARAMFEIELVERGPRPLKGLPDCSLHSALAVASTPALRRGGCGGARAIVRSAT